MRTLGLVFGTLACAATVFAPVAFAAENPLKLWYNSDAGTSFTDALPIGNGYMGGIVYGGVTKDIIGLIARDTTHDVVSIATQAIDNM